MIAWCAATFALGLEGRIEQPDFLQYPMTASTALLSQPLAGVFTAGIAALVALVVSILTKESKTSEFRQQWIDAVRNDIAEFVTAIGALDQLRRFSDLSQLEVDKKIEVFHRIQPTLEVASIRGARLLLRLNPKEHSDIIDSVDRLMNVEELPGDVPRSAERVN